MTVELEPKDLDALAKKVTELIEIRVLSTTFAQEMQQRCNTYVKQLVTFYTDGTGVEGDAAKTIKPILLDHLKTTNVVKDAVAEFLRSNKFKQLTIQQLEDRIRVLRRELEEEQDND